jgi:hypothetical protein
MASDSESGKESLSGLETAVLRLATSGTHADSAALQGQLEAIVAVHRTYTGSGFYLDIEIDHARSHPAVDAPDVAIHGITAEIEGLENGAGFVVSVRDGYLAQVEGFSYDERWPVAPLASRVSLGEAGTLTRVPRTRSG